MRVTEKGQVTNPKNGRSTPGMIGHRRGWKLRVLKVRC